MAGLSDRKIALRLNMNRTTVSRVFIGTAPQKQVWPIARLLKIDWCELHDLTPKPNKIDRAASLPASTSVRSQGRQSVGGASAR